MARAFQNLMAGASHVARAAPGTRLLLVASVVWLPAVGVAAVPVGGSVDQMQRPAAATSQAANPSRPAQQMPSATAVEPGAGSTDDQRLGDLFHQLQTLQEEVAQLRGLVEEQSHQISRIARDQQEQYMDLDRRVAALRNNGQAPALTEPAPVAARPAAGGPSSERDAYTNAFNLMKNRQFDESADAFNKLIVDYPNGQYTPNAFYWLGELYLAKGDLEKARQSFTQVVNLYPDHQKVPDALYKLGVVYHRLGDVKRALEYFSKVESEHPQSSAASLAANYAAELK